MQSQRDRSHDRFPFPLGKGLGVRFLKSDNDAGAVRNLEENKIESLEDN